MDQKSSCPEILYKAGNELPPYQISFSMKSSICANVNVSFNFLFLCTEFSLFLYTAFWLLWVFSAWTQTQNEFNAILLYTRLLNDVALVNVKEMTFPICIAIVRPWWWWMSHPATSPKKHRPFFYYLAHSPFSFHWSFSWHLTHIYIYFPAWLPLHVSIFYFPFLHYMVQCLPLALPFFCRPHHDHVTAVDLLE